MKITRIDVKSINPLPNQRPTKQTRGDIEIIRHPLPQTVHAARVALTPKESVDWRRLSPSARSRIVAAMAKEGGIAVRFVEQEIQLIVPEGFGWGSDPVENCNYALRALQKAFAQKS